MHFLISLSQHEVSRLRSLNVEEHVTGDTSLALTVAAACVHFCNADLTMHQYLNVLNDFYKVRRKRNCKRLNMEVTEHVL